MQGQSRTRIGEEFAPALLTGSPPYLSERQAQSIATKMFGVSATAHLLTAERDQNFRICSENVDYVLKVSHSAERAGTIDRQSAALDHIAANDAALSIPRVVRTRDGGLHGRWRGEGGESHLVRLYSYLPGTLLHLISPGPALLEDLGRMAARLDRALQSFDHAGSDADLLWGFGSIARIHALVPEIAAPDLANSVARAIDAFEAHVLPHAGALKCGAIHYDLNPHNVLVAEGSVSGILDFGDMAQAPLVAELAIAACYHLGAAEPLTGAARCVAGYRELLPLDDLAIGLLADFIAARCAITVAISEWRAKKHPANAAYILRNNRAARIGLRTLENIGRQQATEIFAAARTGSCAT